MPPTEDIKKTALGRFLSRPNPNPLYDSEKNGCPVMTNLQLQRKTFLNRMSARKT